MYIDLKNIAEIVRTHKTKQIKSLETLRFYMEYGFRISEVHILFDYTSDTMLPFLMVDMWRDPSFVKPKRVSRKNAIKLLLEKFESMQTVTPAWLFEGLLTPEGKILKRSAAEMYEGKYWAEVMLNN